MIQENLPMVNLPATLSKKFISEILRTHMITNCQAYNMVLQDCKKRESLILVFSTKR